MKPAFYQHIFDKQQDMEAVPSNDVIADWAQELIHILYPEKAEYLPKSVAEIEEKIDTLQKQLARILNATKACSNDDNREKAARFFSGVPGIYAVLNTDVEAILAGDPAAISPFEVIRAYPGFYAICFYRIAHALLQLDIPLLPRILTEYAHSKTGIDIHPGASIGRYCCIDHGTGVVIGETTVIGDHVKLYQGVTLGALSVDKGMAFTKRHPTVEDHVVIYSGATILGGDCTIGHHSIVGGNVWLTRSIPPYSTVYHRPDIEVVEQTNV
ncbi:MAG: serine O-acetyltransferase EpsC [Chitinophagaceae bacterium]